MTSAQVIIYILAFFMIIVSYQKLSVSKSEDAAQGVLIIIASSGIVISYILATEIFGINEYSNIHAIFIFGPIALCLLSISSFILPAVWGNRINILKSESKLSMISLVVEIVSFITAIITLILILMK